MAWNNTKSADANLTKMLHYGAQISISLAEDDLNRGYIYGDGFITKTISYKKEAAFELEDFTGAIFKIMQPFSYIA